MKNIKSLPLIDKITNFLEFAIAFILLIVIVIKIVDMSLELTGFEVKVLAMDFESILTVAFNLVIGAEFIKMLCKHTPETVIDVLLFTIARQMVLSHEGAINILILVVAIAGLFAVKKYLIGTYKDEMTMSNPNSIGIRTS